MGTLRMASSRHGKRSRIGAGDRTAAAKSHRYVVRKGPAFTTPDPNQSSDALLRADCDLIDLLERHPRKYSAAFQMARIADWTEHAIAHSAWWRKHLNADSSLHGKHFQVLPLMTRADFQASVRNGPLPL